MSSNSNHLLGKELFYGWYFKCQNDEQTLALIPAFHRTGTLVSGSIQLITADGAWEVPFPASVCSRSRESITLGGSVFSRQGICLKLAHDGLSAIGELFFGPLTPLSYDIMGIVGLLPRLECRHLIFSMSHTLQGFITLNEETLSFEGGRGYWEGDCGCSFPQRYLWSHCFFPGGSLMLAVADVPLGIKCISGVIAVVSWQQQEYRLASYLGARVVQIANNSVVIQQGRWRLTASLLEQRGHQLKAPSHGAMERTIREHPCCTASYALWEGDRCLFSFTSSQASFEYEYPF